jgi:hypothetical protein
MKNAFFALVIALGLGAAPTTYWCQTLAPTSLWGWYWLEGDCRGCKKLRLELLLDGKSLYRCSIRVRRVERDKASSEHLARTLVFSFKGGHNFQNEYPTTPQQTIEVNIWQAGAEPDMLILGLSFVTKGQRGRIVLNTLHFAAPDRASEMLLDRGLLIRTYPEPRPRPQSRPREMVPGEKWCQVPFPPRSLCHENMQAAWFGEMAS